MIRILPRREFTPHASTSFLLQFDIGVFLVVIRQTRRIHLLRIGQDQIHMFVKGEDRTGDGTPNHVDVPDHNHDAFPCVFEFP